MGRATGAGTFSFFIFLAMVMDGGDGGMEDEGMREKGGKMKTEKEVKEETTLTSFVGTPPLTTMKHYHVNFPARCTATPELQPNLIT